MSTPEKDKKTKWHSPIYRGFQLDLRGENLKFQDNISLSDEALEIDAVITKGENVKVEKDIAAIFRGSNICEFKSETDYFSVNDYSKVFGYTGLYCAFRNVSMTDVTITIVVTKYPRNLVKFLEQERGLRVQGQGNGIHYILGDIYPVQILKTNNLSDDNLFLKNLRSNLTTIEMKKTLQALENAGVADKRDAYLACIIKSNWEIFREVINMMPELKERFLETAEQDGWLRDRDLEKAKKLIMRGYSVEDVAEAMELPVEMLKTSV